MKERTLGMICPNCDIEEEYPEDVGVDTINECANCHRLYVVTAIVLYSTYTIEEAKQRNYGIMLDKMVKECENHKPGLEP